MRLDGGLVKFHIDFLSLLVFTYIEKIGFSTRTFTCKLFGYRQKSWVLKCKQCIMLDKIVKLKFT